LRGDSMRRALLATMVVTGTGRDRAEITDMGTP
jgi:hypothetical protein